MEEIKLLHEGYMRTVENAPTNIAFIYKDEIWTYYELNQHVNGIRRKIKNISSDKIIAVIGEKSSLIIASILAILMEGLAYLPLDINYPAKRIKYILDQSNVKNLLCVGGNFDAALDDNIVDIIMITREDYDESFMEPLYCDENDLSYVIYTSGSTGNPNGVMIRHCNICNTINWRTKYYNMKSDTITLQYASLSFDSSVEDIFCTISSGGTLIIPDEKRKLNMRYIQSLIDTYKVTHMLLVPSVYELILKAQKSKMEYIKEIVLAGENINIQILHKHFEQNKHIRLYNEYGPTENSVCSTVYQLGSDSQVSIGKPISDVNAFIFNEKMQPVGINENGVLYVGGKGVALGYINNTVETERKFLRNNQGERIYCTGDVVYKDENDNLIFVGRNDNEIKINGIRINLEEIAQAIKREVKEITECVCTTVIFNDIKKVVLVIIKEDEKFTDNIKYFLIDYIPKHLIPNYLFIIDEMPKLPNQKIDYKKVKEVLNREFEMGCGKMREEIINKIKKIISKYSFDLSDNDDNLLEVGIDSLSLVEILIDLESEFDIEIDLVDKDIDDNFTINFLCEIIEESKKRSLKRLFRILPFYH